MMKNEIDYNDPYGYWEVTTEGDCEGRSTRQLGTFEGYIDEIALGLADKCYYSLTFKKVDITPKIADSLVVSKVSVSMDYDSSIWRMSLSQKKEYYKNLLRERPCFVNDGTYGDVVISNCIDEKELKKREALRKLTKEERELLGL